MQYFQSNGKVEVQGVDESISGGYGGVRKASVEGQGVDIRHNWKVMGGRKESVGSGCMEGSEFDFCFNGST